ncbi:hypothetical protein TrLO_g4327 [Triparma laevis f. longispina]|uniref:Uncharacterized protein n=1 Tax=Triparma laevis f. longispina TaxID=1714387 RepID=A0A9W7FMI9_9STRA|nr:hypothetical protein TrLO_g4327 [Triparma laevis f. longispina]
MTSTLNVTSPTPHATSNILNAPCGAFPSPQLSTKRVTHIHHRRRSIDQYVQRNPQERLASIKQISVVRLKGGGYDLVDSGQVVATGCLARETGDALISVMLRETQVDYKGITITKSLTRCLFVLLLPPLIAGAVYGLIPLKCPGLGVIQSGFAAVSFIPPATAAPGLGFLMLHALGVNEGDGTITGLFAFTFILSFFFSITMIFLGTQWMFPIPFGFIVCASPSFGISTVSLFAIVFGRSINMGLIKKLLPLIGVSLMPIAFSATFGFYRTLFAQLGPFEQGLVAPFWVAIKIAFKKTASILVDMGNNPDAAPYLMFCFDAVAAMAGNFLFLSTSHWTVVFVMILVDMTENAIVGLRVVYLILKSRSIAPEEIAALTEGHDLEVVTAVKQSKILRRLERHLFKFFEFIEPNKRQIVPEELMEDIDRYGQMNIYLARATRLLLSFIASEMSEMVTSCWCIIMLPFYFYGPNKPFMYTLDEFDQGQYNYSIAYSLTDFAMEMVTFSLMLVLFTKFLHIEVLGVGVTYLRRKSLFLPILSIACTITIASFTFFLKHFGMDPTFSWEEYSNAAMNVTANHMLPLGC